MHDGAVLGDDVVEDARLRKDLQQLAQLAAGDQDQLAAGRGQRAQRFDATLVATAVARQRSVEPCGKSHVSHRVPLPHRQRRRGPQLNSSS